MTAIKNNHIQRRDGGKKLLKMKVKITKNAFVMSITYMHYDKKRLAKFYTERQFGRNTKKTFRN